MSSTARAPVWDPAYGEAAHREPAVRREPAPHREPAVPPVAAPAAPVATAAPTVSAPRTIPTPSAGVTIAAGSPVAAAPRTAGQTLWGVIKAVLGTSAIYLGAVFAAVIVLFIIAEVVRSGSTPSDDLAHIGLLFGNLLVLIIIVMRARSAGRGLSDLLAPPAEWRTARRLLIPWGIGAALLASLVAAASLALPSLADAGPTTVSGLARLGGPTWLAAVTTAVIVAPLVEELMFRGHLQGKLAAAGLGRALTVLVATSLFTAFHVPLPIPGLVIVFVLGWACGQMRERTGSVLPGMMLHAGWNTAIVLISVLVAARLRG